MIFLRIYNFKDKQPFIASNVFIADNVVITGEVIIGEHTSIWFNTVIRGDVAPVIIGNRVNIQDNSVLHQSDDIPLIIEDNVTIGHQCILHSATIKKGALIGMGSIVMDGAEIGEGAYIGAGSLVSQGKIIPPNTLAYGRPAKVIRSLTQDEQAELVKSASHYVESGKYYKGLLETTRKYNQQHKL